MSKRPATKAEKRHLDRVASMPCVLCEVLEEFRDEPVEVHHIREGQGMSQRASHYLTIPLHSSCHRGKIGVHGDRTLLKIAGCSEMDLLALTIERLEMRA